MEFLNDLSTNELTLDLNWKAHCLCYFQACLGLVKIRQSLWMVYYRITMLYLWTNSEQLSMYWCFYTIFAHLHVCELLEFNNNLFDMAFSSSAFMWQLISCRFSLIINVCSYLISSVLNSFSQVEDPLVPFPAEIKKILN